MKQSMLKALISSLTSDVSNQGLLERLVSADNNPDVKGMGRQTLGGLRPTKKTFRKSKQRAKVAFARKCNKLRRMK